MSMALALDALESAHRLPTAPLLWQALTQQGLNLDPSGRRSLAEQVARSPCSSAAAEWLRCSALAHLTNDNRWLARQAACADATFTADALMSFLGLVWGKALLQARSHQAFAQLLIDAEASRLQRLVAAQFAAQPAHPRSDLPRAAGAPRRVAVYTPEIGGLQHGGTALTLRTMQLLVQQGCIVHAFSAKEVSIPHTACYHGGKEFIEPLPVQIDVLQMPSGHDVHLTVWDHRFSLRSRFDKALQAIWGFAPDLVLFVGLLSPLVYALHARWPVLGLSVHALPPLVPVDVWLSANPAADAVPWPEVPPPLGVAFSYRFVPAGPVTAIDRHAAGLPAQGTWLVTAGFRLEREIVSPWSEQMLAWLDAHPGAHWLLIGAAEGGPLPSLPPHPRIHLRPPQHHLAPWLATCDIYVNPPRVGGGGSVAMAMEQGLAVLTLADGDAADKVGNCAVRTVDAYFERLSAWAEHADQRRAVGNALRERFQARLDITSQAASEQLTQACHRAVECHQQRAERLHA